MKNSKTVKSLEEAEKKVPKIGKSAAQKFKDKYTK